MIPKSAACYLMALTAASCSSATSGLGDVPDAGNAPPEGGLPADAPARGDAEEPNDAYDGIYDIVDVTLNDMSCATEGASVLEQQTARFFFVQKWMVQSTEVLQVVACADPADCRDKAMQERNNTVTGASWAYVLTRLGPHGRGESVHLSSGSGGICTGESLEFATMTNDAPGTLRIRAENTLVPDHPADASGTCTGDALEAAAAGASCTQLKVITGTFRERL
jgi:hypothetical protein